jgi:hypothetical protein
MGDAPVQAMSAGRDDILEKLRQLVRNSGDVEARLQRRPLSTRPAQRSTKQDLLQLFELKARHSAATVALVHDLDSVPATVQSYLLEHRQPLEAIRAADPLLDLTPWLSVTGLNVKSGPVSPDHRCGITIAEAGVAETG